MREGERDEFAALVGSFFKWLFVVENNER